MVSTTTGARKLRLVRITLCIGVISAAALFSVVNKGQIGRGIVRQLDGNIIRTKRAYKIIENRDYEDFTFSFEGRAPEKAGNEEVGI